MSLNLSHSCAEEATFKFKSSREKHNLISNELCSGVQTYPLFSFSLKLKNSVLTFYTFGYFSLAVIYFLRGTLYR